MDFSIWGVTKRAGVPKSTVSRVLNGNAVGQTSHQKVMDAVKEMGCRSNYMARGLRGNSSSVIGVLSLGGMVFHDPSLYTRFAGVADVLQRQGYDLFLVHDDYDNFNGTNTPKYMTYPAEKRINGLIALGATDSLEDQIKNAATKFRNVVYIGNRILSDKGLRVYLGNYNYSYDLFHLLLEYSHRRILMIYRDNNKLLPNRREAALKDAAESLSISGEVHRQFYNPYKDTGYSAKTSKLQEAIYHTYRSGDFTAVFADESIDTRTILGVFAKHEKILGKDYSLVTIGGSPEISQSGVDSITSVHLPDYDYGKRITELMIEVIEDDTLEYKDVCMSYSLTRGNFVRRLLLWVYFCFFWERSRKSLNKICVPESQFLLK